jgi:hypothetical protein
MMAPSSPNIVNMIGTQPALYAENRTRTAPAAAGLETDKARWSLLTAAVIYFAVCVFIQWWARAASAAFGSYPDEPAHYISGLLIRDLIRSGSLLHPYSAALHYYSNLPYFAIGYWPPGFYCVEGLWIYVFGPSRTSVLLLSALFASGSALLIMSSVRRHVGLVAGFFGGLLFLTLPATQTQICSTMVDLPVTFGVLSATCFAIKYLNRGRWADSLAFAVCAAATCLTKYSALYVFGIPFLGIVVLRRWHLLRSVRFWVQPLIIVCLMLPWVLYSAHMATLGLPPGAQPSILPRIPVFLSSFAESLMWPACVVVLAGIVGWTFWARQWPETGVIFFLHAIAVLMFLVCTPISPESRYFTPASGAILIGAVSGLQWPSGRKGRYLPAFALAICVIASASIAPSPAARLKPNKFQEVVKEVLQEPSWRGSRILVAADAEGPMIAEFAMSDPNRPSYTLIRPGKLLASDDWFGGSYTSKFNTSAKVQSFLAEAGIQLVIVRSKLSAQARLHESLLSKAVYENPAVWCDVGRQPGSAEYRIFQNMRTRP